MRINARLDEQQNRELDYLKQSTHTGTSEVVREAIHLYYQAQTQVHGNPAQILDEVGFIACGDADPGLSEDYKHALTDDLAAKYGHR